MAEYECSGCGRRIINPTLIVGLRLCGSCVLQLDEDDQLPTQKHLANDWRSFTTKRRRQRIWR